jgi:hypothetical protein
LVLEQLADTGTPARVETEAAHGTHLPFVLPSALGVLAGVVRRRSVALAVAAFATAAIVDELEGCGRLMRRTLAHRQTSKWPAPGKVIRRRSGIAACSRRYSRRK